MANTSVWAPTTQQSTPLVKNLVVSPWAQLEQDAQTAQLTANRPAPGPSVWAPVGDSGQMPSLSKFNTAKPDVQPAPSVWAPVNDQGKMPDMSAFAGQPKAQVFATTPQQQEIANTVQRLQHLHQEETHPWGTNPTYDTSGNMVDPGNHPGKLGKFLHTISTIGNIAGDIFAPRTMELIPGTQLNRQMQEGEIANRLNSEIGEEARNEEAGANTAKLQQDTALEPGRVGSEEALNRAQIDNLNSEAAARNNPSLQIHDTADGPLLINPKTGMAQHVDLDGQPVGPKLKLTQSQPIIGEDGKPHTFMLNEKGEKVVDLGEHYERPINVNAGDAAVDRLGARLAKPYQTASDASQKTLDRIDLTGRNVDAGYVGQGLAIPELLTSLVSGQGTGVRITQPELNAITKARGIQGDAESWFNTLAGKGSLTAQDKAQIKSVLNDARTRILQKQQIVSNALDSINGADSRQQVQEADKTARKQLNELEKYGHFSGEEVQLKNGQTVTIKSIHPDGSIEY